MELDQLDFTYKYSVTVPYVDNETSSERVKWVSENIVGLRSIDYYRLFIDKNGRPLRPGSVNGLDITYFFELEDDAMRFKMRWG